MTHSLCLITFGTLGLFLAGSMAVGDMGPCFPFDPGPCWCSHDIPGGYWYYCKDWQHNNGSCSNVSGPCDIESAAKCYTNLTTVRMKCDDDSSCTMGCTPMDLQCSTIAPLCP